MDYMSSSNGSVGEFRKSTLIKWRGQVRNGNLSPFAAIKGDSFRRCERVIKKNGFSVIRIIPTSSDQLRRVGVQRTSAAILKTDLNYFRAPKDLKGKETEVTLGLRTEDLLNKSHSCKHSIPPRLRFVFIIIILSAICRFDLRNNFQLVYFLLL